MSKTINWFLYGAALSGKLTISTQLILLVNLISLISGAAYAWTSPTLPRLNNAEDLEDNPFGRALTPFEESWLTSIISVGASIGPFVGAFLVDKIGRKKFLLLLAAPMIVSHLIITFAKNLNLFYASRFLLGLSVGCVYSVIPIYVGEIAEDCNRGSLGCFLTIINTTGTLLCFIIGPYLSIKTFALVLTIPAFLFLLIFGLFIPESPYYLLMKNNDYEARLALKKLRRNFIEKEMEEIKKNVEESSLTKVSFLKGLKTRSVRRGLILCSGLMIFQQSSGITVIISYLQSIFDAAGVGLAPEISSMAFASVQLIANASTSQLVDRLGRRILLLNSLVGSIISNTLLGLFFYLKVNNFAVVSYLSWLPITSLMFYIVLFMSGLGPVTWAMIGELFPTHFRSFASAFLSSICLILAFFLTLFFPNLNRIIGFAYSFWLFALSSVIGLIFVYKMVPETKGKSLHEIQVMLENNEKL